MINFDFYTPTRVLFGADRENEAGKQVAAFGGHKVMIIYGKKGGHVESSTCTSEPEWSRTFLYRL